MIPPTLNGMRVTTLHLYHLWKGAWIADCDLDLPTIALAPTSGPAIVIVGGTTLVGTIDPRASGTFVSRASVRVVGGGGGWDKPVPHQDFVADPGVISTTVYAATAALVMETVIDLLPSILGPHVVRTDGPASQVFGSHDWYVDTHGITHVGPRLPAIADTSLVITNFDAGQQRAEFACDTLLMPATILLDARLNGASPIVRDVEQIFDQHGSRGYAWCAAQPATRLLGALEQIVRTSARSTFMRAYRYRLVVYQGTRLALQAVSPTAGVPDIVPLAPWAGLPGASSILAPSQEVFVAFDCTTPDNPQPIIIGYSLQSLPMQVGIDASMEVSVGATTALVSIAGGALPVALATPIVTVLSALQTWSAAVAGALQSAGFPIAAPQSALVAVIAAAKTSIPATKTMAT